MTNAEKLALLIGPFLTVADTKALGGCFAKYEADFTKYSNLHWKTEGANWEKVNYYDRAFIYYVAHARSGVASHLTRANAIARDYLNKYVIANNYGVASWWSMPKGIAALYLKTGNKAALTAIGKIADNMVNPWNTEFNWKNLFDPKQAEGREQARTLEALTMAILLDAKSVGVPNIQANGEDWGVSGGNDFRALAKSLVNKILTATNFQKPNGSRPNFVEGGTAAVDKPFMNGIMNDALIDYFYMVEPDPRIAPFIKKNLDFMWANEWNATAKAFQYIDKMAPGITDKTLVNPAPDLNMLVVNGFGFVYQQMGLAIYKYRGDLVFEGGVAGNWLEGSKQFNQKYARSCRYVAGC